MLTSLKYGVLHGKLRFTVLNTGIARQNTVPWDVIIYVITSQGTVFFRAIPVFKTVNRNFPCETPYFRDVSIFSVEMKMTPLQFLAFLRKYPHPNFAFCEDPEKNFSARFARRRNFFSVGTFSNKNGHFFTPPENLGCFC